MSRAVFLSIMRLFILDQTWFSGDISRPHSDTLNEFYSTIETATKEIIKNEHPTKGQAFPTGRTLVKKEIARIAFHPLYRVSLNGLTSRDISRIIAFLSTTDYEVSLVALEFLHRIFLSHADGPLAEEHVDAIVKELLKLMLDSKIKGECLAMVSQVYMINYLVWFIFLAGAGLEFLFCVCQIGENS